MLEIKNIKNFNLDDTVTCGQIFRFEKENDNSYTIILKDRVINVKYKKDTLYIESDNYNNLEQIIIKYFDLDRNYDLINKIIIKNDKDITEIVNSCKGLKMINSYPFETSISYIISANNSVPSIKKSVDKISEKFGKKVVFKDNIYYLFPTKEQLKNVTIEQYRECGVGFRDKYIYSFVEYVNKNSNYLEQFKSINGTDAFNILQQQKGIGPKVSSCILLFAYQKFDVFPIDTWVKKVMKDKYNIVGEKNIRNKAKELYGDYSAIAIQYMFHYGRNKFTK